MSGLDRLFALAGEHEAELGYLCRKGEATVGVVIRVFEDKPGFVRIDATQQNGESTQLWHGALPPELARVAPRVVKSQARIRSFDGPHRRSQPTAINPWPPDLRIGAAGRDSRFATRHFRHPVTVSDRLRRFSSACWLVDRLVTPQQRNAGAGVEPAVSDLEGRRAVQAALPCGEVSRRPPDCAPGGATG